MRARAVLITNQKRPNRFYLVIMQTDFNVVYRFWFDLGEESGWGGGGGIRYFFNVIQLWLFTVGHT